MLTTDRLVLDLLAPEEAAAVVDYLVRNREHLAPWEPIRPPQHFMVHTWQRTLAQRREEAEAGTSLKLFLRERQAPYAIVGSVNVSNVVRGSFHAAHLGYAVDGERQGKGYMREALQVVIEHAFGPFGLHRLMANYLPHNTRSAALLARLGFVREGYARSYLKIAGRWQDHVLTARVDGLVDPAEPSPAAAEAQTFAAEWLSAWTGGDAERLVGWYGDDAVYVDPAAPAGLRGREALRGRLRRVLAGTTSWRWTQREVVPMAGGFVSLWRAEVPGGETALACGGVNLVWLRGRMIRRHEVYCDRAGVWPAA